MAFLSMIKRNFGFKSAIFLWVFSLFISMRMNISRRREEQTVAKQRAFAELKYRKDIVSNALLRPVLNHTFPFHDSLNIPIWDQYNRVLFCWLPKNVCSQIKALYCQYFMAQQNIALDQMIKLSADPTLSHQQFCGELLVTLKDWQPEKRRQIFNDKFVKKFAILREPFDRFISGWYNKCGPVGYVMYNDLINNCYGCETVTCFAKKNLVHIKALSRLYHKTFYRTAKTARYKSMDHFYPQYWHCDFEHYLNDYRLLYYEKTESFNNEIRDALMESGIETKLIQTGWGENRSLKFLETSSLHATNSNSHKWTIQSLKQDMEAVDCVYRTYLIDYVTLNFKIPDWVRVACEKHTEASRSQYLVCQHLRVQQFYT